MPIHGHDTEKMLDTGIFSFSRNVFSSLLCQGHAKFHSLVNSILDLRTGQIIGSIPSLVHSFLRTDVRHCNRILLLPLTIDSTILMWERSKQTKYCVEYW